MASGQQQARRAPRPDQDTEQPEASSTGESPDELDDVDSLLDEIDEVLEENPEDFVRNYVQKGGQ